MIKRCLLPLIAFLACVSAIAQPPADRDMEQWVKETRDFKHAFLAKELNLSREQQPKFFKVYDAMEDEMARVNSETRKVERRILDASEGEVADLEYDMATEALFNQRAKESEIELRYLPEFKEILTKKQLFELKNVERKFSMTMMRRHHELRRNKRTEKN